MAKKKGMTRANKFSCAKNKTGKMVGTGRAMLNMRPKVGAKMKKLMGMK